VEAPHHHNTNISASVITDNPPIAVTKQSETGQSMPEDFINVFDTVK